MFDVKLPPWWVGLLLLLIILIWAFYRWPKKTIVIDFLKRNFVTICTYGMCVAMAVWGALLLWNIPEWNVDIWAFVTPTAFIFLGSSLSTCLIEGLPWKQAIELVGLTIVLIMLTTLIIAGQFQSALMWLYAGVCAILIHKALNKFADGKY